MRKTRRKSRKRRRTRRMRFKRTRGGFRKKYKRRVEKTGRSFMRGGAGFGEEVKDPARLDSVAHDTAAAWAGPYGRRARAKARATVSGDDAGRWMLRRVTAYFNNNNVEWERAIEVFLESGAPSVGMSVAEIRGLLIGRSTPQEILEEVANVGALAWKGREWLKRQYPVIWKSVMEKKLKKLNRG